MPATQPDLVIVESILATHCLTLPVDLCSIILEMGGYEMHSYDGCIAHSRMMLRDQIVINAEEIERHCPLDSRRGSVTTAALGKLNVLHHELLQIVIGHLDVKSLFDFRRVSRSAMHQVDNNIEFTKIRNGAPDAFRLALSIEIADQFTLTRLFEKLCQRHCDHCGPGKLAPYIDLFKMERLCLWIGGRCRDSKPPYKFKLRRDWPLYLEELPKYFKRNPDEVAKVHRFQARSDLHHQLTAKFYKQEMAEQIARDNSDCRTGNTIIPPVSIAPNGEGPVLGRLDSDSSLPGAEDSQDINGHQSQANEEAHESAGDPEEDTEEDSDETEEDASEDEDENESVLEIEEDQAEDDVNEEFVARINQDMFRHDRMAIIMVPFLNSNALDPDSYPLFCPECWYLCENPTKKTNTSGFYKNCPQFKCKPMPFKEWRQHRLVKHGVQVGAQEVKK